MEESFALELAKRLTELAQLDPGFRDLYLERAQALIRPHWAEEAVTAERRREERLRLLRSELQLRLRYEDWVRVRALAREIEAAEGEMRDVQDRVAAAASVYGAAAEPIGSTALALAGVRPIEQDTERQLRFEAVFSLERLAKLDRELETFYLERRAIVARLAGAVGRPDPSRVAPEVVRRRVEDAIGASRWRELEQILDELPHSRGSEGGQCACGEVSWGEAGATPILSIPPVTATAQRMGFESMILPSRADLREFMSCRCVLSPGIAEQPVRSGEPVVTEEHCSCGARCPHLPATLRQNLDLLKHRIFVTSLGERYLPLFAEERVLLETFDEKLDLEPLELPHRLGLRGRRGPSRREVERALGRQGPQVVRELELDPAQFRLVPVPFDVHLRAAQRFGGGSLPRWTHFDGYQIAGGWDLHALAGGHASFGGELDLCSVSRDYDGDSLFLRFAIVDRHRTYELRASAH